MWRNTKKMFVSLWSWMKMLIMGRSINIILYSTIIRIVWNQQKKINSKKICCRNNNKIKFPFKLIIFFNINMALNIVSGKNERFLKLNLNNNKKCCIHLTKQKKIRIKTRKYFYKIFSTFLYIIIIIKLS